VEGSATPPLPAAVFLPQTEVENAGIPPVTKQTPPISGIGGTRMKIKELTRRICAQGKKIFAPSAFWDGCLREPLRSADIFLCEAQLFSTIIDSACGKPPQEKMVHCISIV
jgi:hypothetical protein